MTRQEHLDWSKKRAIEILDTGDTTGAYTSMASDLGNHPETAGHIAIQMGMQLLITNNLDTQDKMRNFIEGFN